MGVGKVGGENGGERGEQRGTAGIKHRVCALSAGHAGGLGRGLHRWVERAWSARRLRRSGREILDCEGVVEGITYLARPWQSEARHWTGEKV